MNEQHTIIGIEHRSYVSKKTGEKKEGYNLYLVQDKVSFLCVMTPYRAAITMIENEEGGHDLVNDLKRSGKRVYYTIPKTALVTEKLGYQTEQIISAPLTEEEEFRQQLAPSHGKKKFSP